MDSEKILQLKITLLNIEPVIWRKFLVKDSITFEELHELIQNVMGWNDYHLYEFAINDTFISPDDEDQFSLETQFRILARSEEYKKLISKKGIMDPNEVNKIIAEEKKKKKPNKYTIDTPISELLNSKGQKFTYTYDIGDYWEHELLIEKISEPEDNRKYPYCIEGERNCPPEDCGNVNGYYRILNILKDENHPERKELFEWLDEDYDPEEFDVALVNMILNEEEYISIDTLLLKDEPENKINSISIDDSKFKPQIMAIEYAIAESFFEEQKYNDKDIEKRIKNLQKNYAKGIDFFESDLEKDILKELSYAIQRDKITSYELKLAFDYVLYCIDNRTWVPDKQAYQKWLLFFFDLYSNKEKEKYKKDFTKMALRLGVPQSQIKNLLMEEETIVESKVDKDFLLFTQDNKEKYEYMISEGYKDMELTMIYIEMLTRNKDILTLNKFCQKCFEATKSPLFEMYMGISYYELKKYPEAKLCLENTLKAIEDIIPKELLDEIKDIINKIEQQKYGRSEL